MLSWIPEIFSQKNTFKMLRHCVTVLLSLWVTGISFVKCEGKGSQSCVIQPDIDSQYVVAYLMRYQPGSGCYSNSSSPSHQLVHVINVKFDGDPGLSLRTQVVLKIEPKDFTQTAVSPEDGKNSVEVHEQPLVFVLNSQQPIRWKVEVSSKFPSHNRQLFLIPKHSTIRFKKRRNGVQARGRKRGMPSPTDRPQFLSWVRRRFKAVTSYAEVQGEKLLFYVGTAAGGSQDCRGTSQLLPSPYSFAAQLERRAVSGCTSTGTQSVLDRPVYVIELLSVPEHVVNASREVELDITSSSDKDIEHNFYLVLRSPQDIKWVLRSQGVQGWIDVVSDADVDLGGIRMHTVALRHEEMDSTGKDLITWAEYFVAPVRAYTAVSSANVIQLLLPSSDGLRGDDLASEDAGEMPGRRGNERGPTLRKDRPSLDMREHLRHIVVTRCEQGVMEATLPTFLTQELDLPVEKLSLLDGSCRATKNRTHVILRTALNQCQTSKITVDDTDIYSNAIVIHASGMVGAILEEEMGSGYFDLQATSGSGWSDTSVDQTDTTYVDDEDFPARKLAIDVECQVPKSATPAVHQGAEVEKEPVLNQKGECDMHLYEDPFYLQRVENFPFAVNQFSGLYLFASDPSNPSTHVLMENCWVTRWRNPHTTDTEQVMLVQKGCTRTDGAKWFSSLDTHISTVRATPERLVINRVLPHNSYVHCQLSMCREGESTLGEKCPPDPSELCGPDALHSFFKRRNWKSCGLRTIGPVEITDEVRFIDEGIPGKPEQSKPENGKATVSVQNKSPSAQQSVIIEGLESGTVVGIAFAAFVIGILLTGALWFIHTHTGPSKRGMSSVSMVGTSGDLTPNSSSPISA